MLFRILTDFRACEGCSKFNALLISHVISPARRKFCEMRSALNFFFHAKQSLLLISVLKLKRKLPLPSAAALPDLDLSKLTALGSSTRITLVEITGSETSRNGPEFKYFVGKGALNVRAMNIDLRSPQDGKYIL